MPKANPEERNQKKTFLKGLVKDGKVSSPRDAHAALKKKFGRSLTFGEVAVIIGKPGRKKRKKSAAKKSAAKESAAKKSRAGSGRKRGRGPARKTTDHPYAIVNARDEVLLVQTRSEAIAEITRMAGLDDSTEGISLYKKVPISVEKVYRVGI